MLTLTHRESHVEQRIQSMQVTESIRVTLDDHMRVALSFIISDACVDPKTFRVEVTPDSAVARIKRLT